MCGRSRVRPQCGADIITRFSAVRYMCKFHEISAPEAPEREIMELEATALIHRPIAEVFARWSEVERYPDWFESTIERRKVTDGPIGVGTTYHAVEKLPPGRRIETTLEITSYERNELVAAKLSDPISATWEARFEETGDGTRMTFHMVANPSGWQGLLAPLFAGWARRQLQTGLDRFKASVEG